MTRRDETTTGDDEGGLYARRSGAVAGEKRIEGWCYREAMIQTLMTDENKLKS